jgi:UDP-N-acetylglucosamine 2-epimerase (non-hydrolysing)
MPETKPPPLRVLSVFGTRPEAIKMAPVVRALSKNPEQFQSFVCVTAQHRDMLDQVLTLFQIQPDRDLNVMQPNQDLFQITTAVLNGMKGVLEDLKPDIVLVHGDTTTTMATSLACFYKQIPVGHVEAGLRTFDRYYPFPEEINRVVTDSIAALYFAPTEQSKANLLRSGASEKDIIVTGNTVIDALFYTLQKAQEQSLATDVTFPFPRDTSKKLILVTVHRRENFGEPLKAICSALKTIVETHPNVELVIPVHPNPNVKAILPTILGTMERVHLIEPLDYVPFCHLMAESTLILTDSGGVQEEAPSLSKPVLVLRDETERPEAVAMGTVKLVGANAEKIIAEAHALLTDPHVYESMARAVNPYGDGKATERILSALNVFRLSLFKTV